MAKVQEVIEEGLAGVRDDLGKMEADVERLNSESTNFLAIAFFLV